MKARRFIKWLARSKTCPVRHWYEWYAYCFLRSSHDRQRYFTRKELATTLKIGRRTAAKAVEGLRRHKLLFWKQGRCRSAPCPREWLRPTKNKGYQAWRVYLLQPGSNLSALRNVVYWTAESFRRVGRKLNWRGCVTILGISSNTAKLLLVKDRSSLMPYANEDEYQEAPTLDQELPEAARRAADELDGEWERFATSAQHSNWQEDDFAALKRFVRIHAIGIDTVWSCFNEAQKVYDPTKARNSWPLVRTKLEQVMAQRNRPSVKFIATERELEELEDRAWLSEIREQPTTSNIDYDEIWRPRVTGWLPSWVVRKFRRERVAQALAQVEPQRDEARRMKMEEFVKALESSNA
jgi:hypothetical protein